jgi:hypothetical protein
MNWNIMLELLEFPSGDIFEQMDTLYKVRATGPMRTRLLLEVLQYYLSNNCHGSISLVL